ncbi:tetratricopeptide repeat protein [Bradyrhizobium sp. S3.14.4]
MLVGLPVAAQNSGVKDSYLSNIELCNGTGTTSLDARIGACTTFIQARPDSSAALAIAYNNRGNAYTAKGDYDSAISDFDQSIALNPTYAKAFNNRGVAHLRRREYELAIEAFDDAIKLDPGYGAAFVNRAGAYLKKNDHQRAAHDYDEAIRLQPASRAAWSGRDVGPVRFSAPREKRWRIATERFNRDRPALPCTTRVG